MIISYSLVRLCAGHLCCGSAHNGILQSDKDLKITLCFPPHLRQGSGLTANLLQRHLCYCCSVFSPMSVYVQYLERGFQYV